MMQKLGQKGLWKLIVYFSYLCAQVTILGALMLTTTSMIAHTIMMFLSIFFYFVTCFKDPGTYYAKNQPNLQDLSTIKNIENDDKKRLKKKIVSDQIYKNDQRLYLKQQYPLQIAAEAQLKAHKKSSLDQIIRNQPNLQQEKQGQQLKINKKDNLIGSAKNIINSAFNNLTTFMSKKNIQPTNIQEQKSSIKAEGELKQQVSIKNMQQPPQQNKPNINIQSEQKQIAKPIQKNSFDVNANKNSICSRMAHKKRYCRMCEFYQPMRVRHCYSCQTCVSTFDHHCPWLSTCIGQKNKLVFIAYLLAQTLQFFTIFIDLVVYVSDSNHSNRSSVGILLLAVILVFTVLLLLFTFHLYLACHNLTTWELFRWDRIEYLALFDKQRLRSPFSKGFKQNIKTLWEISCNSAHKNWQEQLSQDIQKYLLKGRHSQKHEGGTDRKMFFSHQNI